MDENKFNEILEDKLALFVSNARALQENEGIKEDEKHEEEFGY